MTPPSPTARLVDAGDGRDLVLTRTLPGSIDDAWRSVTEPERTARWIGRWEGAAGVGATIRMQLGFEDGSPWADLRITECDAPHRLRVLTIDEAGTWDVSLVLTGAGDRTELEFTMHRVDPATLDGVGPGWEWYLDRLLASMTGAEPPVFEEYYPAQRAYYRGLAG